MTVHLNHLLRQFWRTDSLLEQILTEILMKLIFITPLMLCCTWQRYETFRREIVMDLVTFLSRFWRKLSFLWKSWQRSIKINIKYLSYIWKIPIIFRICQVEQNNTIWDVTLVRINNVVRNIVRIRFKLFHLKIIKLAPNYHKKTQHNSAIWNVILVRN